MDRNVMNEIAQQVSESPIVLYMKGTKDVPQCGFSAATVQVLRNLGVDFKDVNVLADPEIREGIKAYSKWPTIPQLYVGGEFVGGCDIVREMNSQGELEPLLRNVGGSQDAAAHGA